jgi:mycoredoxin
VATVTMYSTEWCGYCRRLKREMDETGISFEEVDVEHEPEYNERILQASGGHRTVPTVEIDGRLLVNPSLAEVKQALPAEDRTKATFSL